VREASVTPTPAPTTQLLSAGFIPAQLSRFAPAKLVFDAPQSVIRWTFDETHCQIRLHWFLPAETQSGPASAACRWDRRVSVDDVSTFNSGNYSFEVVAGHQARRYGELVQATLSDGRTAIFQGEDSAWVFVVQRCGPGAPSITRIDELAMPRRHVIASLRVQQVPEPICPND
jgi:hypothetical protein